MRILIVDDSVTTRDRLVEVLSKLPGVEHVHNAASPLDATRAIQSGWPDAVVFDIDTPGGSGTWVLEALRTGGPRILSIVLTNDSTPERREACLQAGADFFFDKSWEFQSAVDVVARLARGDASSALPACWSCFEQLQTPTWLYDNDTLAFRAVNDAAVALYGYSREEFLRMTVADIRLDAEAERNENPNGRSATTVQSAGRQRHHDSAGAVLHVEVAVTPLRHDGGRFSVAVAHDLSERVLVEQALSTSEHRYRELFDNATDAMFTTTLNLTFTSFNRAAEALTGYTREQAMSLNVVSLVARDSLATLQLRLADQLERKPASPFETVILTREGRSVPIEVRSRFVYRDGLPVGTQGIARDISERIQLEQRLRQTHEMEAIGRFAGAVAHDFKNQITVIIGRAQEMIAQLAPDDPARAEAAGILESSAALATKIREVQDVLQRGDREGLDKILSQSTARRPWTCS